MSGASAAGPVADAAIDDLRALRQRVERDLLRALVQLDTESGSGELVRQQAQTSAAVYRQIARALEQAGNTETITTLGRRAVEAVEAITGEPAATLSLDVRQELDAIVNGAANDVASAFAGAQDAIRQAINAGVATSGSLDDLIVEVQDLLDTSFRQASAAVDAAIMGAGRRAVLAEALSSGAPWVYLYVGPRDDKNRPFCRKWIRKCVTNPDAVEVTPGQPSPVGTYCGGYNCRHSWAPITREMALARGYEIVDTGSAKALLTAGD